MGRNWIIKESFLYTTYYIVWCDCYNMQHTNFMNKITAGHNWKRKLTMKFYTKILRVELVQNISNTIILCNDSFTLGGWKNWESTLAISYGKIFFKLIFSTIFLQWRKKAWCKWDYPFHQNTKGTSQTGFWAQIGVGLTQTVVEVNTRENLSIERGQPDNS